MSGWPGNLPSVGCSGGSSTVACRLTSGARTYQDIICCIVKTSGKDRVHNSCRSRCSPLSFVAHLTKRAMSKYKQTCKTASEKFTSTILGPTVSFFLNAPACVEEDAASHHAQSKSSTWLFVISCAVKFQSFQESPDLSLPVPSITPSQSPRSPGLLLLSNCFGHCRRFRCSYWRFLLPSLRPSPSEPTADAGWRCVWEQAGAMQASQEYPRISYKL